MHSKLGLSSLNQVIFFIDSHPVTEQATLSSKCNHRLTKTICSSHLSFCVKHKTHLRSPECVLLCHLTDPFTLNLQV